MRMALSCAFGIKVAIAQVLDIDCHRRYLDKRRPPGRAVTWPSRPPTSSRPFGLKRKRLVPGQREVEPTESSEQK